MLKLGNLELKRQSPDEFTRATLLRGYSDTTGEPDKSFYLLAAVGLHLHGPPDWPTMRAGLDYVGYGQLMRQYFAARRIDLRHVLSLATVIIASIRREPDTLTEEEFKAYADFFGVALSGDTDASSPEDTRDQPSGD